MARVLDLGYRNGRPIAVVAWAVRDGTRIPGKYFELDAARLHPSLPMGTWRYDDELVDPD
jgi:hypothetical protein